MNNQVDIESLNPRDSLDELSGRFISIKNTSSEFIYMSDITARLVGFDKGEQVLGLDERELRCQAAEDHEMFVAQDKQTLKQKSMRFIYSNFYANSEYHCFYVVKKAIDLSDGSVGIYTCTQDVPLQAISKYYNDIKTKSLVANSKYLLIDDNASQASNTTIEIKSEKQKLILHHIICGKSAKEIASLLNLSHRTIEQHTDQLRHQFGCYSKRELIDKAIELGYVSIIPAALLR